MKHFQDVDTLVDNQYTKFKNICLYKNSHYQFN